MARNDSLRRGNNIEMLILSILSTEDCYGYQLSLLIKDYSQGKISLPEGSLYPALYKLVDNGLISDEKDRSASDLPVFIIIWNRKEKII